MKKSSAGGRSSETKMLLVFSMFLAMIWVALTIHSVVEFHARESEIQTDTMFLMTMPDAENKQPPSSESTKVSSARAEPPKEDEKNPTDGQNLPRVLAIVFPQFHQDPLNDKLWGTGFTDWENLRKAPLKNRLGFEIPRPTELGYYDYTDPTVRKKQGELAKQYGVDGFVFHHYWFYDKTHPGPNLHAPLEKMLQDGHPDIPFCLHWCAVKWMATWHGKTAPSFTIPRDGVLQAQNFPSSQQHIDPAVKEHYKWLRQFFHHPNYIKVHGEPVFMLYQKKPASFGVLRQLRKLAIDDGFPGLFLTVGLTRPHSYLEPLGDLKPDGIQRIERVKFDVFNKTTAYPNPSGWNEGRTMIVPEWCKPSPEAGGDSKSQRPRKLDPVIPGILTSFDNTPRRSYEEAILWSAENPDSVISRFRANLQAALYFESCCSRSEEERQRADNIGKSLVDNDDRFILINAMNEWAEGMALEPSNVFGRRLLEAVDQSKKDVLTHSC